MKNLRSPVRPLAALLAVLLSLLPGQAAAHEVPGTVIALDVQARAVKATVQVPLSELRLAMRPSLPGSVLTATPPAVLASSGPQIRAYLLRHTRALTPDGPAWTVALQDVQIGQTTSGSPREVTATLTLTPPAGAEDRRFILAYDAVMERIGTHSALVSVRQDWASGVYTAAPVQVGVIRRYVADAGVPPLMIDLSSGSAWRGFQGIFSLGMTHIREGTDHLLFLLTLLLPASLLASGGRWRGTGSVRHSLRALLKIVTAFTAGHSLTLLLGTLGWVRLPGTLTELLIAVSVLVSATHALRPIFPGRELYVAAGFGLIHGLAFSGTLAELQLAPWQTALSLLGFNLGIESMQLVVVLLIVPWLLLLARTRLYPGVRVGGALFAGAAALAWIVQRVSGQGNAVTAAVEGAALRAPWIVLALALLAVGTSAWTWTGARRSSPGVSGFWPPIIQD